MKTSELAERYRITDGENFRLEQIDPCDTCGLDIDKSEAKELLAEDMGRMRKLQERLYAEGKWSVLIILQAMDAAGKDSAIEHVMSGINPQGCNVRSFKAPGPNELKHDFLWRHAISAPERGKIGIHNRSHYEEVLVVRVHPGILQGQGLPQQLITDDIWEKRLKDIRAFERHLANSGTIVLKFFLHISKQEQARRFLDRIDQEDKNWKYNSGDIAERAQWDAYMAAYEDAIRSTSRKYAPWFVVPSDNKWFSRMVISDAIVDALQAIDPQFPDVGDEERQKMKQAREQLAAELEGKGK